MEVTPSQRKALEAIREAWTRPPQEFIYRWNAACQYGSWSFGCYNEETGYFELNGITDISYEEAKQILATKHRYAIDKLSPCAPALERHARTAFPLVCVFDWDLYQVYAATNLEVVRLLNYHIIRNGENPDTYGQKVSNSAGFAMYSAKLREVQGVLDVYADTATTHLSGSCVSSTVSSKLEILWVKRIKRDVDLRNAPYIRTECVRYMVDNAMAGHGPLIIRVHASTYDRLPEDLFAAAAADNITIAAA